MTSLGDSTSRFRWPDYLVFVLTLLLTASVGIYYGIKDRTKKRNTAKNFLLAGKKMPIIPVSVSLFVTWLSAMSFVGDPVEVYYHGAIYWLIGIGYCAAVPPVAEYFAPKLHRLDLISAYEYIERRYNFPMRLACSVLEGLSAVFYSGVVLYAPAISLAQVSGIQVWVAILASGILCTLYTTLGGIKAVLWADTIQTVMMFVGLLAVLIRGSIVLGGVGNIWNIAKRRGRINFNNFDPNPFVRSTFWAYLVGGFFRVFNPYLSSQRFVQRYSSLRTEHDVKIAVYLNIVLYAVFVTMFAMTGLLLVAYYDGCDPLSAGYIEKSDQILPLLMVELLGFIPGFSGLFLAALFCASLSTLSSVQNSLSINLIKDVFEPIYKSKKKKALSSNLLLNLTKIASGLLGVVFIGVSYILMSMKDTSIFQLCMRITGCFSGPLGGLFFLGFVMPSAGTRSLTFGVVVAVVITVWWNVGAVVVPQVGQDHLPITTELCDVTNQTSKMAANETLWMTTSPLGLDEASTGNSSQDHGWPSVKTLYKLSPLLFTPVGSIITIVLGAIGALVSKYVWNFEKSQESTQSQADEADNKASDGSPYLNPNGSMAKYETHDLQPLKDGEPLDMCSNNTRL